MHNNTLPTTSDDRLTIAPEYNSLLAANGLDTLDKLLTTEGTETLDKPDLAAWRQRLRIELVKGNETVTVYLKRFGTPPAHVARNLNRRGITTPAAMEWQWLCRLADDGIAAPYPIALGERITDGKNQQSVVMMGGVPGMSLERVLATNEPPSTRGFRLALIDATASQIARFHELGYVHRDLYACHIFFDANDSASYLIDLQRLYRPAHFARRWIIKDLASLNYSAPQATVSRTDRLRWLKRYLGLSQLTCAARQTVYRIIGKTQAIARHDQRRRAKWDSGGKTR